MSDGSRGLSALYQDKLEAMTLVLLAPCMYRFPHHTRHSPANSSATAGSHVEGRGEQGTGLRELPPYNSLVQQQDWHEVALHSSLSKCSCSPSQQGSQVQQEEPQVGSVSVVPLPYVEEQ